MQFLCLLSVSNLFSGSIWKIPQGPEAVLDQTLTGVRQVKPQGLHATYIQAKKKKHHIISSL